MGTRIVILGGCTAGTMTAIRLCRVYDRLVVRDDDHIHQSGLVFVPFGLTQPAHLVRSRPCRSNPRGRPGRVSSRDHRAGEARGAGVSRPVH